MAILAANRIVLRNSFYLRFLENLGIFCLNIRFKYEQRLIADCHFTIVNSTVAKMAEWLIQGIADPLFTGSIPGLGLRSIKSM